MRSILKFENYKSREEMCQVLCRNGYEMRELEDCSNQELENMCNGLEEENQEEAYESIKEHQETQNYMFFANLQTIKRLADEMLKMDKHELDKILTDGHGWALDHIATSKDDVEEVFNFLASHCEKGCCCEPEHDSEPSHEETEGHLANKDLESELKGIKSFSDFKK
jgi:hypothetical protein